MVSNAYAAGTVKNHKCQWNRYLNFCIQNRLQVFPPSSQNIIRFYTYLTDKLSAFSSLQNYQSSINIFYRVYGFHVDTESILFKFLNMSAKKCLSTMPVTKRPLDPEHLLAIINHTDQQNPFQVCFMNALTIGFFALLRRSNICPPSPKEFDCEKHLTRGDVRIQDDGVIVQLKWSKTNQHNSKVFEIPIANSGHQVLDPPRMFRDFNSKFPVHDHDPCFSFYYCGHLYILTQRDLASMVTTSLENVGVASQGITTHSIRKGGATLLTRSGVKVPALKEHGTWLSDAYLGYVHFNLADKFKVTQQAYKFLNL